MNQEKPDNLDGSSKEDVLEVEKDALPKTTSDEANENRAYISELAQMYKSGNKDIFFNAQNGRRKSLDAIFKEIKLVALHEGFNLESDLGKTFLNEIKSIEGLIRDINRDRDYVQSAEQRVTLVDKLSAKYNELAESVISFLQTEKPAEVATEAVENSPEVVDTEDIDARIERASFECAKLFEEAGDLAKDSVVAKRIDSILDSLVSLRNNSETDPTVAKNKKEKYLKSFLKEIENFKNEIASLKNQAPVPALIFPTDVAFKQTQPTKLDVDEVQSTYIPKAPFQEISDVVDKNSVQKPISIALQPEANPINVPETLMETGVDIPLDIPANETKNNLTSEQLERREARYQTIKAKKVMNELNDEFNEALKEHYKNRTWQQKALDGLAKIGANEDKLPDNLLKLRAKFDWASQNYKGCLTEQLQLRDGRKSGITKLAADGEFIKKAFDQKLVINTYNQQEKNINEIKAEQANESAESRLGKILGTLKEHKGKLRYVGLGVVAGLGFTTGGLSGAGFGAARWAAATFGGAAAAAAAFKHGEKNVAQITNDFELLLNNKISLERDLSVADKRKALRQASVNVDQAKIRQIAKAAAVAFVVGGSVRGISALADIGSTTNGYSPSNPEETSRANVPEALNDTKGNTLSDEAVKRMAALEKVGVQAVSPLTLTEAVVPYYGLNADGVSYETVLKDIKIVGEFKPGVLTDAQQAELGKFIKLSANDILAAHPNVKEGLLEAQLLEKLQNKFGNESWWKEVKVTKVDIGTIETRELAPSVEAVAEVAKKAEEVVATGTKITTDTGNTYTEAIPQAENISKPYTVVKGDTFYEIVEKKFAEDLKNVPVDKRAGLMTKLFERIEGNPELLNSLGIKSKDIDLIYPGEKINLTGINGELGKLIEREHILNDFIKTAPLSVEADNVVKNIPITVVEKPISGGVSISTNNGPEYTEAGSSPQSVGTKITTDGGPTYVEAPVPPRPYSVNGEYYNHPDYRQYIRSVFGSEKIFEQTVERAVETFDKKTYSPFFLFGESYESPYRFLGQMTLAEIAEFEKMPNAEVRDFLQANNIKYETYLAWLDQVDKLKAPLQNGIKLPSGDNTKFSDLFSRYVAETQVPRPNTLIK